MLNRSVLRFVRLLGIGLITTLVAVVTLAVLSRPTQAVADTVENGGIPFSIIASNPYQGDGILVYSGNNNVVRDSAGNLYVVFAPRQNQAYQRNSYLSWSNDQGASWSSAVKIDPYSDSVSAQSLAIDDNETLYHSFTFNVGSFFTRSTNLGQTWFAMPIPLHDGGWGDWDYLPNLVVSDTGKLHAVYQTQFGWNQPPSNLVYKSSDDAGDTWTSRLDLTSYTDASDYGVHLSNLYLGRDGWLFATYNYLHTSTPATYAPELHMVYFDGQEWSDPMLVSTPGAQIWMGGDMVVDSSGLVHLAWSEFDSDLAYYQLRYQTFDPATRQFSDPSVLSTPAENPANVTMGVSANDQILIAYDLHQSPDTYLGVYLRTSHDNYATAWQISSHENGRTPTLRSSFAFMNHPEHLDLIWVEPNPSGGENLVYADLSQLPFVPLDAALASNHHFGQPGSYINLSGSQFPANQDVEVTINGQLLDWDLTTDALGSFTVTLDTAQASAGTYYVTASVNPSATTRFILGSPYPLHPKEGDWTVLEVPAGLALREVHLPLLQR